MALTTPTTSSPTPPASWSTSPSPPPPPGAPGFACRCSAPLSSPKEAESMSQASTASTACNSTSTAASAPSASPSASTARRRSPSSPCSGRDFQRTGTPEVGHPPELVLEVERVEEPDHPPAQVQIEIVRVLEIALHVAAKMEKADDRDHGYGECEDNTHGRKMFLSSHGSAQIP